ncbi:Gp37-like protein [Auritidibacter ignavus]|uniref:Gp37-like protein n=1 Tax=Auritidibacter ignavus TaxID=678932 RepID=UPI002FE61476
MLRHNSVSTGVLDIDGNHSTWDGRFALEGGHAVVIDDHGVQLIAGKLTSIEFTKKEGLVDVRLALTSHLDYLAGMITLPSPTKAPDKQTDRAYYTGSGPAETVITDLIRTHVGQAALSVNRSPLQVERSQGRGKTVKVKTRFKNLLEEVQELAGAGGLQVRTWLDYDTATIRLGHRVPRDLSRSVRLREDDGTLERYSYSLEAPSATRVLVAGKGQGTSRLLRLVESGQTEWETKTILFQDRRDTDDIADLVQAGEQTLAESGAKTSITIDTRHLGSRRFGTDYWLGDVVTVQLTDKTVITGGLQRVEIDWDQDGASYKVSVGPYLEEPDEDRTREIVRKVRRDVRGLEAG